MEYLTPKQIITNWVEVKDQIPQLNKAGDIWLSTKVSILLYGWQSLGDLTFTDWSKQIEPTLVENESIAPMDANEHKMMSHIPILTVMSAVFNHAARGERPIELDEMMKRQEDLAKDILQHTIFILNRFEKLYILSLMDEKNGENYNSRDQPDALILIIIDIMDNYCEALLDAYKHNYLPLSALVLKTMDVQSEFARFMEKDASSRQNRKAALIKNQPNRKTREYAISRYDEKDWKNPNRATGLILPDVMKYALSVEHSFTSQVQAHKCIYTWLLKHSADKKLSSPQ